MINDANIRVGDRPVDIAVNPATNLIYVANSGSNTTSVIDGSTNKLVRDIQVGAFPLGVDCESKYKSSLCG